MTTTRAPRTAFLSLSLSAACLATTVAHAQSTPPTAPESTPAPAATTTTTPPADASAKVVETPTDPDRAKTLEPKLAAPPPAGRATFDIDPVADGAVIAVSVGFAGMLDLINSTGEIRPAQIASTFDRSNLIGIDRGTLSQTIDPNAGRASNFGLWAVSAFAVVDPILSGFREGSAQTAIADGVLYAESFSLTFAMTNMVKMAVRRPRPNAYLEAEMHKGDPNYSNVSTDSSLSFFSGHASITAALGATATYLAFTRSPKSPRPWITLALAVGLSTFVSIERVRAGAHFPTDVIAGTIAGAGVGVVVPHLHRSEDIKQRRVWVGFSPAERGNGGQAMVTGIF